MKSIEKKAEDYAWSYYFHNTAKCGFVAGANYVLDAIVSILSHPTQYVNTDKSVEEGMIDAIIECIEQLKSN